MTPRQAMVFNQFLESCNGLIVVQSYPSRAEDDPVEYKAYAGIVDDNDVTHRVESDYSVLSAELALCQLLDALALRSELV